MDVDGSATQTMKSTIRNSNKNDKHATFDDLDLEEALSGAKKLTYTLSTIDSSGLGYEKLVPFLPYLHAIVLTHGDLAHAGALPFLFSKYNLTCPVVCTEVVKSTAELACISMVESLAALLGESITRDTGAGFGNLNAAQDDFGLGQGRTSQNTNMMTAMLGGKSSGAVVASGNVGFGKISRQDNKKMLDNFGNSRAGFNRFVQRSIGKASDFVLSLEDVLNVFMAEDIFRTVKYGERIFFSRSTNRMPQESMNVVENNQIDANAQDKKGLLAAGNTNEKTSNISTPNSVELVNWENNGQLWRKKAGYFMIQAFPAGRTIERFVYCVDADVRSNRVVDGLDLAQISNSQDFVRPSVLITSLPYVVKNIPRLGCDRALAGMKKQGSARAVCRNHAEETFMDLITSTLKSGNDVLIPTEAAATSTLEVLCLLEEAWNQDQLLSDNFEICYVSSLGEVFLEFVRTRMEWVSRKQMDIFHYNTGREGEPNRDGSTKKKEKLPFRFNHIAVFSDWQSVFYDESSKRQRFAARIVIADNPTLDYGEARNCLERMCENSNNLLLMTNLAPNITGSLGSKLFDDFVLGKAREKQYICLEWVQKRYSDAELKRYYDLKVKEEEKRREVEKARKKRELEFAKAIRDLKREREMLANDGNLDPANEDGNNLDKQMQQESELQQNSNQFFLQPSNFENAKTFTHNNKIYECDEYGEKLPSGLLGEWKNTEQLWLAGKSHLEGEEGMEGADEKMNQFGGALGLEDKNEGENGENADMENNEQDENDLLGEHDDVGMDDDNELNADDGFDWLHDLRVRFKEPFRTEVVEKQLTVQCKVNFVPISQHNLDYRDAKMVMSNIAPLNVCLLPSQLEDEAIQLLRKEYEASVGKTSSGGSLSTRVLTFENYEDIEARDRILTEDTSASKELQIQRQIYDKKMKNFLHEFKDYVDIVRGPKESLRRGVLGVREFDRHTETEKAKAKKQKLNPDDQKLYNLNETRLNNELNFQRNVDQVRQIELDLKLVQSLKILKETNSGLKFSWIQGIAADEKLEKNEKKPFYNAAFVKEIMEIEEDKDFLNMTEARRKQLEVEDETHNAFAFDDHLLPLDFEEQMAFNKAALAEAAEDASPSKKKDGAKNANNAPASSSNSSTNKQITLQPQTAVSNLVGRQQTLLLMPPKLSQLKQYYENAVKSDNPPKTEFKTKHGTRAMVIDDRVKVQVNPFVKGIKLEGDASSDFYKARQVLYKRSVCV